MSRKYVPWNCFWTDLHPSLYWRRVYIWGES